VFNHGSVFQKLMGVVLGDIQTVLGHDDPK